MATTKSIISQLMFGPPAGITRVATDTTVLGMVLTPRLKAKGKLLFQAFLLGLAILTLFLNLLELGALCAGSTAFPFGAAALILSTSGNLMNGLFRQSQFGVHTDRKVWKFLHSDDPTAAIEPGLEAAMTFRAKQLDLRFMKAHDLTVEHELAESLGKIGKVYTCIGSFYWMFLFVGGGPPFLLPGVLIYPWVLIPLSWALMPIKKVLVKLMMYLSEKRYGLAQEALLGGNLSIERKRSIIMILEPFTAPAMSAWTDEKVEARYALQSSSFNLTGAPRSSWEQYFKWNVVFPVWLAFSMSLVVKLYVVLDVTGFESFWQKIVTPLFHSGPEWQQLKGAYLQVPVATFWERRFATYFHALWLGAVIKLKFVNSIL